MAENHTGADAPMSPRKPRPTAAQLRQATFTTCRTLGHAWEYINTTSYDGHVDEVVVMLRCDRCSTERDDFVRESDGDRTRTAKYRHPNGYRDSEHEKLTRAQWRVRFLTSILKG